MKKMTKAEKKAYDELLDFLVQEDKRAEKMTDEEYEKEFEGIPEYMAPPVEEGEVMAIMLQKKELGTVKKKARKRG